MEDNIHVTFEQAKLLKEFGFGEDTRYFYNDDGTFEEQSIYIYPSLDGQAVSVSDVIDGGMNRNASTAFDAPTLEQACRWLRSRNLLVHLLPKLQGKYQVQIWYIKEYEINCTLRGEYETYEEAQRVGIDKALQMLGEETV